MATKGRRRGKSDVLREGEALERSRRTGRQIVAGTVSRDGDQVVINAGGQPVRLTKGRAEALARAASDPKNRGRALTLPLDRPPPAKLVRLSPAEIRQALALARQSGLVASR